MSGVAIILDLLRKNPKFQSREALNCFSSFSVKAGLSAAAAASVASYPFAFKAYIGNSGIPVTHCDAAAAWEDPLAALHEIRHNIPGFSVEPDSVKYASKVYNVEPKPLLSAFHWKALTITTMRSFLLFYLPLLEPRTKLEDDEDEEFLQDDSKDEPVDLITPFKKSLKQIVRESAVVTTRRVLERLAVTYVPERMAWKLLKDAPKSSVRKAHKGMSTTVYFYSVSRTTFRAHCLGVAGSWIVQVGTDIYRTIRTIFLSNEDVEEVDSRKELQTLGRKVGSATLRCSSSLVFASIGAGLGASFIHPSAGQWIGCAVGDLAGPIIVAVCLDHLLPTRDH